MGILGLMRRLVEKATGTHVLHSIPFGIDMYNDIAERFQDYRFELIFDVGANVGQSVEEYYQRYPTTRTYCFEPIKATYEVLKANTASYENVSCHNFALGASAGTVTMVSEGVSSMNHIVEDKDAVDSGNTETVVISTLDSFCSENGIDHISFLKIDTEGNDLDVLKGASRMLTENNIDFVEVEAGMNPGNTYHVSLEDLKSCLEEHNYFIFGIYEQVKEWPEKKPHLRRTNTVFMSEKMINRYQEK